MYLENTLLNIISHSRQDSYLVMPFRLLGNWSSSVGSEKESGEWFVSGHSPCGMMKLWQRDVVETVTWRDCVSHSYSRRSGDVTGECSADLSSLWLETVAHSFGFQLYAKGATRPPSILYGAFILTQGWRSGENTAVFTFPTPSSILKYNLFENESQGQTTQLSAHLFTLQTPCF